MWEVDDRPAYNEVFAFPLGLDRLADLGDP